MNVKNALFAITVSSTLVLTSVSFDASAARARVVKRSGPATSGVIRIRPKPGPTPRQVHRRSSKNKHYKKRRNRWRTAAAVTLTASAFRSLNCSTTTIISNGVTYYSTCGKWYHRGYSSGTVVYIESNAPAGY